MHSPGIYRNRKLSSRLALAAPVLARIVQRRREARQRPATLEGYIIHIRVFLWLCERLNYALVPGPWDPDLMSMYLEVQRMRLHNSVQSYRTWESAVKWLGRCLNGTDGSHWYHNADYRVHRDQMLKEFYRPPADKLPFYIEHIRAYTLHHGVRPGRYTSVSYDALLFTLWLQLCFITFSRPCEVLNQPSDDDKCGLRWKDVEFIEQSPTVRYWRILVRHFKNQRHRGVPKEIWLGDASCGIFRCPTGCRYINPFWLLHFVRERRLSHLESMSPTRRQALDVTGDAKVFVRWDGTEMLTTSTRHIIQDVIRINDLSEPHRFSEYSNRVGGTTQASAAAIPDGYQYAWVGWSKSNLPDSAKGYCRPGNQKLLRMPFYLLHGFTATNGHDATPRHDPAMFRDLWDECKKCKR